MPYEPGHVPENAAHLREFLVGELSRLAAEVNQPNPQGVRFQAINEEPPRPRVADMVYTDNIPLVGWNPGEGPGIYWWSGSRWRIAAGVREAGILGGPANSVIVTDVGFADIDGYANSAGSEFMGVDPVAGTITLPDFEGWIRATFYLRINQVGADKDFSVLAHAEVNGTPLAPWGSGYIPQQSSDIDLFISGAFSRPVAGNEVIKLVVQADGNPTATFQVVGTTFEIEYILNAQLGDFIPGVLP